MYFSSFCRVYRSLYREYLSLSSIVEDLSKYLWLTTIGRNLVYTAACSSEYLSHHNLNIKFGLLSDKFFETSWLLSCAKTELKTWKSSSRFHRFFLPKYSK